MKRYNEKFTLKLSSMELEYIEYAVEEYRKAKPNKETVLNRIIKKLYSEAHN